MKAVILARGRGTRMQTAEAGVSLRPEQEAMADAGLKAMIPVPAPFLDYVISALADAGCRDLCLVVAPDDTAIRPYYDAKALSRTRIAFAIQHRARGTGDAVLSAEPFTGGEPFLVLNADNYYPVEAYRALVGLDGPGLPVFRQSTLVAKGNIAAERVRAYAVVTVDGEGHATDIIEKPEDSTLLAGDPFVSMNCWRFDATIFTACRAIPPSPRGEFELPNAVRHAIAVMRVPFRAVPIDDGVLDLSRRRDIPEVERRLAGIEPCP
jgi:glucose-1-phosphate thymidylyltransferase